MDRTRHWSSVDRTIALLGLVVLAACGGSSLIGPESNSGGVSLQGTVIGSGGSAAASSSSAGAGFSGAAGASASTSGAALAAGPITVTLQGNPAITATVAEDGSFTLRGLPEGGFTLVFTRDGATIGTLTFTSVRANQQITITVSVNGGVIVLLEERRNGVGHSDAEVEGRIDSVITLNAIGDSWFLIRGRTVVVRPGVTTIRRGNTAMSVASLVVGTRVHVKGASLPAEGAVVPILAHEIKLQDDDDDDDDDGDPSPTPVTCIVSGGRVGRDLQLEGVVVSGAASSFLLRTTVDDDDDDEPRAIAPVGVVSTATTRFDCPRSGSGTPTPAQCQAQVVPLARVHVSGTLTACTPTTATVAASRVDVRR